MVKAAEIRSKTKAELQTQLEGLRGELLTLRIQKIKGGNNLPKFQKIGAVRKNIARVLTVMNQSQRDVVKAFYLNKKYQPLDLRTKKTRAIRRSLSKEDAARKTQKQIKKERHFPARKYAVAA